MLGRRKRAAWLLLVVFASMCLGACTAVLSASGKRLSCCEDFGDGRAAFTPCCGTGQQSTSADLPIAIHTTMPAVEVAFVATPNTAIDQPAFARAARDIPFRSADPQAFLSTFLI